MFIFLQDLKNVFYRLLLESGSKQDPHFARGWPVSSGPLIESATPSRARVISICRGNWVIRSAFFIWVSLMPPSGAPSCRGLTQLLVRLFLILRGRWRARKGSFSRSSHLIICSGKERISLIFIVELTSSNITSLFNSVSVYSSGFSANTVMQSGNNDRSPRLLTPCISLTSGCSGWRIGES